MASTLDNIITSVSEENQRLDTINLCFVYFLALAETRRRGYRSDLFDALDHFKCFGADLPQDCDDATALRLRSLITEFIETCPVHPSVLAAFRILHNLSVGDELKSYFISKLKFFHAQGNAQAVFQLCTELEDLGVHVFRDEQGAFIPSRSSCEAEKNMGVARRFLERLSAEPNVSPNSGPAAPPGNSGPGEGPLSVT